LETLSIKDDRKILKKFLKIKKGSQPLILLRHAEAISRKEWQGGDEDRPLSKKGINQVSTLVKIMSVFNLSEIHTSDAIRCFDTVAPIATSLAMKPIVNSDLSEYTYQKNRESANRFIKKMITTDKSILICGHNPIISKIVKKLARDLNMEKEDFSIGKGDAFIIHRKKGKVLGIDYLKN
jgi:phosphohistidine phosphatase SixA